MGDDQPMWDKRSEVRFTPRSAIKKTDDKMVEINKGLIKMINTISFDGEPSGNPYQHLEAFEDICELVNSKEDEVKLRVFPFTLAKKAKDWFKQLLPGSITTWDDLKSAFLSRYFPISKAHKIRAEIRNFKQGKDILVKAWGRYKSLFLVSPNHGIDDREMIDVFYAGLTNDSRLRLDSSCGGIFPYKTVKQARKLLDNMEAHYLDWSTDEEQEETQPAHLNVVSSFGEHIHAIKDFTETPNPLFKPYGGVIEQLFHHFSQEQEKMGADVEQKMQGFVNFIAGLSRGADQFLRDVKETFPHMEAEAQAEVFTTTRGGKVVVGPPMPQTNQIPNMQVVEPEVELPSRPTKEVREEAVRPRESTTPHVPTRVPYPARLRKEKKEAQYRKFIDLIKRVYINVPLVDLIAGVPSYARFLKELVADKARMGTEEIAFLNAECSATLSDTLKKGDLGSFIIPCYFGKSVSCRALADLEASINLMPLSFYQKLGLNDLKSTRMTIQLADRSIAQFSPRFTTEKVENVKPMLMITGEPSKKKWTDIYTKKYVETESESEPDYATDYDSEGFTVSFEHLRLKVPDASSDDEEDGKQGGYAEFVIPKKEDKGKDKEKAPEDDLIYIAPIKHDPGSYNLPISCHKFSGLALVDSGAALNMMPVCYCRKMGVKRIVPTNYQYRGVNGYMTTPLGIAEGVPIRIGKFVYYTDFVIANLPQNTEIPIILGRSFLHTAQVNTDMRNQVTSLGYGDNRIYFDPNGEPVRHLDEPYDDPSMAYTKSMNRPLLPHELGKEMEDYSNPMHQKEQSTKEPGSSKKDHKKKRGSSSRRAKK
ncbi:hypothetical protein OSB04_006324 [Centaurea solstitialis]|uniref:Retrotransposon gag domain-containing protein n=1 Tax=Centaurea solstitialis TaxID=347529 RepID=A0AA38THQ3_9ASTR|nr:hypothetical protein OSB04_006324 [Centaurea solstitialis]